MKIIFLGQAGLYFETNQLKILIDPYFSNSVEKVDASKKRKQIIDQSFFAIKPNFLVFTHSHIDHYDEETVSRFLTKDSAITVLSPKSVWERVRRFGGNNNYVQFNCGSVWTEKNLSFTATYAEHSDEFAIGVIINFKDKNYYITGDTLYNQKIFTNLPKDIYAVFLPINGVGNNMNALDAQRFARKIGAQKVVPIHFDMFDDISPEGLDIENKVIPTIYKEIEL